MQVPLCLPHRQVICDSERLTGFPRKLYQGRSGATLMALILKGWEGSRGGGRADWQRRERPPPQVTNNVPFIFLLKCPAVARNTI